MRTGTCMPACRSLFGPGLDQFPWSLTRTQHRDEGGKVGPHLSPRRSLLVQPPPGERSPRSWSTDSKLGNYASRCPLAERCPSSPQAWQPWGRIPGQDRAGRPCSRRKQHSQPGPSRHAASAALLHGYRILGGHLPCDQNGGDGEEVSGP